MKIRYGAGIGMGTLRAMENPESDIVEGGNESAEGAIGRPEPWRESRYQSAGTGLVPPAGTNADGSAAEPPASTPVTEKDYEELAPPSVP